MPGAIAFTGCATGLTAFTGLAAAAIWQAHTDMRPAFVVRHWPLQGRCGPHTAGHLRAASASLVTNTVDIP